MGFEMTLSARDQSCGVSTWCTGTQFLEPGADDTVQRVGRATTVRAEPHVSAISLPFKSKFMYSKQIVCQIHFFLSAFAETASVTMPAINGLRQSKALIEIRLSSGSKFWIS